MDNELTNTEPGCDECCLHDRSCETVVDGCAHIDEHKDDECSCGHEADDTEQCYCCGEQVCDKHVVLGAGQDESIIELCPSCEQKPKTRSELPSGQSVGDCNGVQGRSECDACSHREEQVSCLPEGDERCDVECETCKFKERVPSGLEVLRSRSEDGHG